MKNILVAWDFVSEANRAFRFAIEIASVTGYHVLVAHIIEPVLTSGNEMSGYSYKDQITHLSEAMEKAENDFENLKNDMGIISDRINLLVDVGLVNERMSKIICEQKIDLVITGRPSGKWLEECMSCTNPESIVFSIHVPVLTLHVAIQSCFYRDDPRENRRNSCRQDFLDQIPNESTCVRSFNYSIFGQDKKAYWRKFKQVFVRTKRSL